MSKIKTKYLIAGLVVVVLAGFAPVLKAQMSEWLGVAVNSENVYINVSSPETSEPTLGALSGPDIPSPYLRWGGAHGVRLWPTGRALSTATTTICSIQSPAATSTLVSAGIKMDVSSTTAMTLAFGRDTSVPTATTTLIGTDYAIAANARAFVQASTSPAAGAATVFGPSEYLNVKAFGGVGTFSPTGACHATFEEYISL